MPEFFRAVFYTEIYSPWHLHLLGGRGYLSRNDYAQRTRDKVVLLDDMMPSLGEPRVTSTNSPLLDSGNNNVAEVDSDNPFAKGGVDISCISRLKGAYHYSREEDYPAHLPRIDALMTRQMRKSAGPIALGGHASLPGGSPLLCGVEHKNSSRAVADFMPEIDDKEPSSGCLFLEIAVTDNSASAFAEVTRFSVINSSLGDDGFIFCICGQSSLSTFGEM
ncbi:hypothetical protein Taro_045359 [Colocasia esculenta]|uniref:Uncharacterized protein n=1 Tax=Colocasia esculenta TaxID=4460 RepID=A0A843WLU1_COLES|nr:hypothetical protein [Colocasia esculenta]